MVPLLFVLMIAILEFGYVTKNTMTLSSAAREAARKAAVGGTTAEITNTVNYYASPISLASPEGSITLNECNELGTNCIAWPGDDTLVSPPRNKVKPPNMVRVTLTSRHQSLTGVVPGLNNRVLTSSVTIRRES